jgi:hypothetical protein
MDTMTQAQFFILLGTVLAGVIWQRVDIHQLSGRLDRMQSEMNARIDRMSDDMKQFYRTLGQHDARLDSMEKSGN